MAGGEPGQMVSDPRRPMPGTKLVREWNGVEHTVAAAQVAAQVDLGQLGQKVTLSTFEKNRLSYVG